MHREPPEKAEHQDTLEETEHPESPEVETSAEHAPVACPEALDAMEGPENRVVTVCPEHPDSPETEA